MKIFNYSCYSCRHLAENVSEKYVWTAQYDSEWTLSHGAHLKRAEFASMGVKLCRVWWFYSSCVHCVLQLHCDPEHDQMQEENGMDAHLAEAVLNCFPASELSRKNAGNCSNDGLLLCTVCPLLTTLWSLKCGKKKKKHKCNVLWTSSWEQRHSGRRTLTEMLHGNHDVHDKQPVI